MSQHYAWLQRVHAHTEQFSLHAWVVQIPEQGVLQLGPAGQDCLNRCTSNSW